MSHGDLRHFRVLLDFLSLAASVAGPSEVGTRGDLDQGILWGLVRSGDVVASVGVRGIGDSNGVSYALN